MKKKSSMPNLKFMPYIIFAIIVIAYFFGRDETTLSVSGLQTVLGIVFLLGAAFFVHKALNVVGSAMRLSLFIILALASLGVAIASGLGLIF